MSLIQRQTYLPPATHYMNTSKKTLKLMISSNGLALHSVGPQNPTLLSDLQCVCQAVWPTFSVATATELRILHPLLKKLLWLPYF
mmetsp:Transcript_25700/g.79123  ORF Transcript_25700/g.79123 Transcript_25700/m.79123 type:complete len:85 (-) Transcript_25700:474-728(-)